jgi:rhodanese-related sulfurtransferase
MGGEPQATLRSLYARAGRCGGPGARALLEASAVAAEAPAAASARRRRRLALRQQRGRGVARPHRVRLLRTPGTARNGLRPSSRKKTRSLLPPPPSLSRWMKTGMVVAARAVATPCSSQRAGMGVAAATSRGTRRPGPAAPVSRPAWAVPAAGWRPAAAASARRAAGAATQAVVQAAGSVEGGVAAWAAVVCGVESRVVLPWSGSSALAKQGGFVHGAHRTCVCA